MTASELRCIESPALVLVVTVVFYLLRHNAAMYLEHLVNGKFYPGTMIGSVDQGELYPMVTAGILIEKGK